MSVRKVAAIVAVGALAILSVVTGSSPAWAAVPNPPVIAQSHTPWVTTSSQESEIHGSMDLGVESVTVSVSSDGDQRQRKRAPVTRGMSTCWSRSTSSQHYGM